VAQAWASFDAGAIVGDGYRLGPSAWCVNEGPRERVQIAGGGACRGIVRREQFGDGAIRIGEAVYIGDDCILSCCDGIEIGDGTLLGHGVQIFDNNSHPIGPRARTADAGRVFTPAADERNDIDHARVRIGADVWLGFGTIILKGVTVGDGAVIAAGSIVTADVAAHTIVAGNPVRVVRELT